ncbi:ZP domain-containing protein-like [Strongylocentrotus purpuratus]|uniref:ZP domain-containing protein n=1 Tax=Strongylocentrotus purpuratus TaxID=7668 RepID=A0A7M7NTY1_STRPU|nr:ZP domain-containing protein-like [Strongylocentrotus purpuratus]
MISGRSPTAMTPANSSTCFNWFYSCPDDETVAIYRLLGLNREGFSFSAFAFVGDYTEVYIHCSVKVCGAAKAQLFRDAGCPSETPPPDRKRRSSSFLSTQTISNGPIHIRRSTSDMVTDDLSSYIPFAMLLLGMIATLVAMAILMGGQPCSYLD